MRNRIILPLILFSQLTIYSQGFLNRSHFLLNKNKIKELNISSVVATSYYPDSSFHPLSNFVFEYTFDKGGNIVTQKHWSLEFARGTDIFLNITLLFDSIAIVKKSESPLFINIGKSKTIKFDQTKNRTEKYIFDIFDKLGSVKKSKKHNSSVDINGHFIDTILMGKKVCIPNWLIPNRDSISASIDTIKVFSNMGNEGLRTIKCYKTTSDTIQIDWEFHKYRGHSKSFFIDKSGLICKEIKNNYTILYFYDPNGLLIKEKETNQGATFYTYKTRGSH